MIVQVFMVIGFFSLSQSKSNFMPNLPVREYRLVLEKLYPCELKNNNSFQLNISLNKKTSNLTEIKGNISFLIDLDDDTLTLDANVASWGSIGGWKTNSIVYTTKKACSAAKNLAGNSWFTFLKGFNIPTDNCPLPAGTYSTTGIDLKKFEDNNFPKVYFYGKYKVVYKFKNPENIGEYRLVLEKLYPCELKNNNSFQFNVSFSKKTSSITEVQGNISTLIDFDDTLTLDMNVASWGSIGGWKPNSMVYITKKACSAFKNLAGNS
ncbi:hypothetical protein ACI65C_009648 [Semiaphis heraclei]